MDVDHLIESVKCSRLEEGFEAPVCRHSFLLGLLHSRVRVRSSNPKMAAGRGIPPEHQTLGVVFSQVDMKVERQGIGQVVIVQGDAVTAHQVRHRIPHQLERPNRVKSGGVIGLLSPAAPPLAVVCRNVTQAGAAHHLIVHFDEHIRILGVDLASQPVGRFDVLLTSRRNAVAMLGIPALPVVHRTVKHEESGAIPRQGFEARLSLFNVLRRRAAQRLSERGCHLGSCGPGFANNRRGRTSRREEYGGTGSARTPGGARQ